MMTLENPNDSILQSDTESAAKEIICNEIVGKTFLVTGATGLIGSQFCKALLCCNRLFDANITVVAFLRNLQKAHTVFGELCSDSHLVLLQGDINEKIEYSGNVDYIVHGASATGSKYFVSNPVETINTALNGTNLLLEFAREKEVDGVVYLSSLEVYGTPDSSVQTISEDYSGYINPLSVRSSYSEGKRIVECLCASYASEYGVPVKIARLSQTFGAGVEYNDGRVFAEFARCAIEKKDIVLHTMGNTVRSYCYTRDAITALAVILLKGEQGKAYNVTNMNTACSIKEMAELVCETFPNSQISVKIDIPEDASSFGYNPEMIIRLDSTLLENLGWKPTVDLSDMFKRMVSSILERK